MSGFSLTAGLSIANTTTSLTVNETVGTSALLLVGATQTTSNPVINATQTWNNAATTFTGFLLNVTNTASNANSLLMSLQLGGSMRLSLTEAGYLTLNGGMKTFGDITNTNAIWNNRGNAAGAWQFGSSDAAAPQAQTLTMQSVIAGTSNTVGQNFILQGSAGTGTGVGGSLIFQVAPVGSSGTTQNVWATALTIDSTKTATFTGAVKTLSTTVSLLPAAATAGSGARAFVTDATATTFLSIVAGSGANKVPVVSDGTNWLIG